MKRQRWLTMIVALVFVLTCASWAPASDWVKPNSLNVVVGGDSVLTAVRDKLDPNVDDVYERLNSLRVTFYGTSAPASPDAGQLWYDSTEVALKRYSASGWVQAATPPSCTYANLPAASSATAGRTCRVTDKAKGGVLYMDNGTDWVPQGDISGMTRTWEGTIAAIPLGYGFCNGAALNRANYPELFAAIGTIHGVGDGSTTFNIPDKRDSVPVGAKQDDLGKPKTNWTGSLLQSGGSLAHNHCWYNHAELDNVHDQSYNSGGSATSLGTGVTKDATHRAIAAPNAAVSLSNNSLFTNETVVTPPFKVVVYIIKY